MRPSDKRGRTLKVSLRTDGFVPVLHLQGDVAMAVNALSGMEGVRARSPVGVFSPPPPSSFPVYVRPSSSVSSAVSKTSSSAGVSLLQSARKMESIGPRAVAVSCVRGFCFFLNQSLPFLLFCRQYHTASFLIAVPAGN